MATKKSAAKKSAGKKAGARRGGGKAEPATVTAPGKPTKSAIPPPARVSVEVLLPPAEAGLSAFATDERISCTNVAAYRPERATHDTAAKRLSELGFRIVAHSAYSISVEGTPSLFTKTFGTDLEVRSIDRVQSCGPMREKAFFAPAAGAPWQPPAELSGLIERAYVQPPAIYFESALPPQVPYFHLNVPGDVAMLTRATEAHQRGITGKGVKVVMIDSGFFNHKFYRNRGFRATVMLGPGAVSVNRDDNGHGTAEAANVFATAPGVNFTMIKQGDNSTAAFKKAVELRPDIITCSWGFDLVDAASPTRAPLSSIPNTHRALELEVANAVASGICVVFASGNGHVAFPGMHPDVISVGGVFVDQDQNLVASDYASAFDSRPYPGRHVPDVCGLVGLQPNAIYIMLPLQPGCEIDRRLATGGPFPASDQTVGTDGWSAISGTSAAAPQIAGICALLKQKNPSLTPQEIKQALLATAVDCSSGSANPASNQNVGLGASAGIDGATGHGLADAAAAVDFV